jgi:hypothetical protein
MVTKRTNTRQDFTQVAFAVVQQATGEAAPPSLTASQKAGRKGGKARMAVLTDEERHELAMRGVEAREQKKKAPAIKTGA